MRILITGASGTVGRLIHMFTAPYNEVVALSSSDVDLTDEKATRAWFNAEDVFDVVIHCAIRGANDVTSTDLSIMIDNLKMYHNILNCHFRYKRFINIASGTELEPKFKRSEASLYAYIPESAYALSKNLIARDVKRHDEFYNLRLFGLASHTRVFARVMDAAIAGAKTFDLVDRYMDYITEEQLDRIIKYYIRTEYPEYQDINMVPKFKFKVSTYVQDYINNMGLDIKLNIIKDESDGEGYTGDSSRIEGLGIL